MSHEESFDVEDAVDPRVQVQLERLNAATDEINKLEVELDDCRNHFRHLLTESSKRIETCSKKLGTCIEKARPYYDARLKAKEALRETQKVAIKYEKANSAHAAAKEMVFLAEEGLQAEGRTFDHAWQEMLNHATMRVNESEAERTLCEAEHKQASQVYQGAELRVQTLQRELKRAISKSRPYFELKIHCNQLLEDQKRKVKTFEKQIADNKLSYAETLRSLEQISDEIHQIRQYNKSKTQFKTGTDSNESAIHSNKETDRASGASSLNFRSDLVNELQPLTTLDSNGAKGLAKITPTSGSSLPDTDIWSEATDSPINEGTVSPDTENESSLTGLPDTDSEDNALKPVGMNQGYSAKMSSGNNTVLTQHAAKLSPYFDGVGICSFPIKTELSIDFPQNNLQAWTEISLCSPNVTDFPGSVKNKDFLDEDFDIPYAPLSEVEGDAAINACETPESTASQVEINAEKSFIAWLKQERDTGKKHNDCDDEKNKILATPRKKVNLRRQSLDVLFSSATGEKMKEMLSQSILKLNIGSVTERRNSESKLQEEVSDVSCRALNELQPAATSYEANLSSQFGLQFFARKGKLEEEPKPEESKPVENQETLSNQIGALISRKEKFFTRKVPNPLERTLSFLNADEDSTSDTDSLQSVDMLTDEQLSALVLDQDLAELYQDLLH